VPFEILEKILNAGRLAPSACNYQPWRFLVVSSGEVLHRVRESYNREWFKTAPHVLVATGIKSEAWVRSFDGYCSVETDVAIAMTHILLAAENEGIGACWVAAFDPGLLRKALNIDKAFEIYALSPLGYPKPGYRKSTGKKRKPLDNIVEYL
jgi:nitroreductase